MFTPIHRRVAIISHIIAAAIAMSASGQAQNFRDVQIETVKVTENVYMLIGAGGNIGVSIGDDGVFMIDDQFAPLTGKILEAISRLSDSRVRFLINTHWHFDHTGGNENFGGDGAVIVAHANVRKRMSSDQFMEAFDMEIPAAPDDALPVITFEDSVTFHWNNDELHAFHMPHAHTDGDTIIHFRKGNVFHMGDIYFSNGYPFIDAQAGGSINGIIRACDHVLGLCNAETKIIPGHGNLANPRELQQYRNMLETVRDKVAGMMADNRSREEIIAARPTRDFDAVWGNAFMQPDQWVGIVYDSLAGDRKRQSEAHTHDGHTHTHSDDGAHDHDHQPQSV